MSDTMAPPYPTWKYYPPRSRPPDWVPNVVTAFAGVQGQIDSQANRLTSDTALAALRPALVALDYETPA